MPRIRSQCNTADFKDIEHLASTYNNPEMLDPSTLKKKQKLALAVVFAFTKAGLSFRDIYTIKEILFWDDGRWEYRFHPGLAARAVLNRLREPTVKRAIEDALRNLLAQ